MYENPTNWHKRHVPCRFILLKAHYGSLTMSLTFFSPKEPKAGYVFSHLFFDQTAHTVCGTTLYLLASGASRVRMSVVPMRSGK